MVFGSVDIFPVDQSMGWSVIQLGIENGSPSVLNSVLDGSNDNNDNQRYSAQSWIRRAEDGEDLALSQMA